MKIIMVDFEYILTQKLKEKNVYQHRIKLIASADLLTKIPLQFSICDYLLTLVLKHATKSYTRPLAAIKDKET